MRVARLDLVRYGCFTGASVPFDAAAGCDLHVLYGDNEAGKSTALDALLDLLYGIGRDTARDHLHPRAAMRLGALIEGGAGAREVLRLGGTAGMFDGAGRPSPEGNVPAELAGLGRDAYRTMFSLDERTLAAGGEGILRADGDLGRLLFSATAGMADLSRPLDALRARAEAFFKPRGRTHALAELKRRLADLKARRDAVDVLAPTYAGLAAARDAARAAFDAAAAERGRLRAALDEADRQSAALPRLHELRLVREALAALPPVPAAPASWRAGLPELQRREVELETRSAATSEEVARLGRAVAEATEDAAAAVAAARLEALADARARHATAVEDLPRRRAALAAERAAVAAVLADLGWTGAEGAFPPPPPGVAEGLRDAMEAASGVAAACEAAEAAHEAALDRLGAARADLPPSTGPMGGDRDGIADGGGGMEGEGDDGAAIALAAALAAARGDDAQARVRVAERDVAAKAEALSRRLSALAPWRGDVAALAAVAVPDPGVRARYAEALDAARAEAVRRASELAGLEDEAARARGRRDASAGGVAAVGDDAAAASRAARDRAWAAHRASLDCGSAEAFERLLRADDALGAARLARADALGEARAAEVALSEADAALAVGAGRLGRARAAEAEAGAAVDALVRAAVGPGRDRGLAALDAFAADRARALEARDELRDAERGLTEAREDAERIRAGLAAALASAGAAPAADGRLDELAAAAQARLDADARRRRSAAAVAARVREAADCARHAAAAGERLRRWTQRWEDLLARTWLPAGADAATVRAALDRLPALAPALARRDGLALRVAGMEADVRAFAASVAEVAEVAEVGTATVPASPLRAAGVPTADLLAALEARIAAWRAERAAFRAKEADLADARRRLEAMAPALAEARRRRDGITAVLGVASLAEAALALDAAARADELAGRAEAIGAELVAACAVRTPAEAEEALASLDPREVADRRLALAALREDADGRAQELYAALGRTEAALVAVDGGDAAARIEAERRTVLLEIEEGALAHLALKAGIASAEAAVRLYRERHRSSMMAAASAAFAAMTRGAYDGLAAQGGAGGEVLVGLVAGGGSRLAREMSTATRAQLYLALRIAGHAEYARTRRPPPLVLDDVLETFDDGRAGAALAQLAAVSATGQVIYLTHHRHLCDIARRVCPAAGVREIAP